MLLDFIQLTPYVAIAATLLLAGTIAAVCMQSAEAPKATGFGTSRDRRRVFYRGAVGNPRRPTPGHTAKNAPRMTGQY